MDSILSWLVFMWLIGSAIVVASVAIAVGAAWAVDSAFNYLEVKVKERRVVQEK